MESFMLFQAMNNEFGGNSLQGGVGNWASGNKIGGGFTQGGVGNVVSVGDFDVRCALLWSKFSDF